MSYWEATPTLLRTPWRPSEGMEGAERAPPSPCLQLRPDLLGDGQSTWATGCCVT